MKIHFIGDIMLGRGLHSIIEENNSRTLANSINQIIPKEDIIVANLETPLTLNEKGIKLKDSHLTFKLNPNQVSFFNQIGISLLTLANNHITDYGSIGVHQTINTLKEANISSTGAGLNVDQATLPAYLNDGVNRYAILAFNAFLPFSDRAKKNQFGYARFDKSTVKLAIENCEKNIDGILISVHWGIDYHQYPVPALLNFAKELLDKYPQIITIIGHHPHLQQPLLYHKGKPIFCSLGNFLFDEPFSLSRIGSILTLNLDKNIVKNYSIQFTLLNSDFKLLLLEEPLLQEEKNRLNIIKEGILKQNESFLLEDKKWIKYLIYQSIRYLSWNNFSYLLELYSIKKIFDHLLKR